MSTRQACCSNCSAWERNRPMAAQGMCHRNPPAPVLVGITEAGVPVVRYYWVETLDTSWCRDGHEFHHTATADANAPAMMAIQPEGTA
jgi:hypothetical protein